MELKFALLCDSANESREGKLNILGEFNSLFAQKVPIQWPAMTLAARFEAAVSEGSEHNIQVVCLDEDGNEVLPKSPEMPIRFVPTAPGRPLRGQVMLSMAGVRLPDYGDYEFHLLVDGRLMGRVPLYVTKRPKGRSG